MRSSTPVSPFSRRALLAMGLTALAGGLLAPRGYAKTGLLAGAAAPPATLVTLDGERVDTATLAGQVVILAFWATWCVPCREELPLLSEYAVRHAHDGLRVLGFSLDPAERRSEVRAFAAPLRFPVGLLAESNASGYGRMWRLPVSFVIARDGTLAVNGWDEKNPVWTAERLEREVTPLLATPPAEGR